MNPGQPPKKLLDRMRDALRARHYAIRTEDAYVEWARRFILFHGKRHPKDMGAAEIEAFLTYLAVDRRVAASTQNQALSALLFLFREVLNQELDSINLVRARKPKRLPTVLTKGEAQRVITGMSGVPQLAARLLYGSGLRILECLRLRVKDVDFEQRLIVVRDGKGEKDRITMLPDSVVAPLQDHLARVRQLHSQDLAAGDGAVRFACPTPSQSSTPTPTASGPGRRSRKAGQYVFPARSLSTDPRSGERRRHHLGESGVQKAVRQAARLAGIAKPATCHTFRHSFATHLLENGYDTQHLRSGQVSEPCRNSSATKT